MPSNGRPDVFAALRTPFALRGYQQRALNVVARLTAPPQAQRQLHFVAPPGAGKTILGLELIRRYGQPALVLAPNTAIQRQWLDKARLFIPPDSNLEPALVVGDRMTEPPPAILALTYQSLTVASREGELLDSLALALWGQEAGDPSRPTALGAANPAAFRAERLRYRQRVRARLLDDTTFDATTLLHPSAQALARAIVERGTAIVILDECHHLTGTWAILIGALIRRLEGALVVGLTATPPVDRTDRERSRYLDLVGEIDFEMLTPAVVRDGALAPYQDLAYFTTPTPDELRFVASQHAHWIAILTELNADGALDRWVQQRLATPTDDAGQGIAWDAFAQRRPAIALSLARWALARAGTLPEGVRLTNEMIEPLEDEDRLRVLGDFALRHLKLSADPADAQRLARLRAAGRSLGYLLTESGFRRTTAPVDRLLALSRAKAEAVLTILGAEWEALGERLRAVVITDFERSSATLLRQLEGVLDPDAEGAQGVMRLLATSPLEEELRPVLVTGQTLLCDDRIVEPFMAAARAWFATHRLDVTLRDEAIPEASLHRIHGSGPDWTTGNYVAMVTSLLAVGVTRCLVGTRALLGEGWDSLVLNTFIDLTYATTFAAVNQLRGRAIRLDPTWPEKVANNWDVVCVAPGFEKGMVDYERFVRKHDHYLALSDDGVIEAGVGHVHPLLHRVSGEALAAERDEINAEMLARAKNRPEAARRWAVGSGYEDRLLPALDLRLAAPDRVPRVALHGVPRGEVLRPLAGLGVATAATLALTPVVVTLLAGLIRSATEAWLGGGWEIGPLRLGVAVVWLVLAATVIARSALLLLRGLGQRFAAAPPDVAARAMGLAVLEAMQQAELLPATIAPEAIRVTQREEGMVRVWLDSADGDASLRFARAMAELLSPVTASARYIIPRYEIVLRGTPLEQLWGWLRWVTNRWVGEVAAWHPVPSELAARADRVRCFEEAWQRHVSPGEALFMQRAEGTARLRAARALPPPAQERRVKRIWR